MRRAQPRNWAACSQIRPMTLNSFPLRTRRGRSFPAPAAGDANYLASCSPVAASGAARRFLCHRPGLHPPGGWEGRARAAAGEWTAAGEGLRGARWRSGCDAPTQATPGRPRFLSCPRRSALLAERAQELASGCVHRTACPPRAPGFSATSLPGPPFLLPPSPPPFPGPRM